MKQQHKILCELVFFWTVAGVALAGDGGERIALVIAWAVGLLGVIGPFALGYKEYRDIAKKRIKKGYGEEPTEIVFLQLIPLIASMAYLSNMVLAGFLMVSAILMAELSGKVNEAIQEEVK